MLPGQKLVIAIFFTTLIQTAVCMEDYTSDKIPDVVFKYYNKDYPNNDLVIFASETIEATALGWRKNTPVKIITHGWLGDGDSPNIQDILHGFLLVYSFFTTEIERELLLWVINMCTKHPFSRLNITLNIVDERFIITITSKVPDQLPPKLKEHLF